MNYSDSVQKSNQLPTQLQKKKNYWISSFACGQVVQTPFSNEEKKYGTCSSTLTKECDWSPCQQIARIEAQLSKLSDQSAPRHNRDLCIFCLPSVLHTSLTGYISKITVGGTLKMRPRVPSNQVTVKTGLPFCGIPPPRETGQRAPKRHSFSQGITNAVRS